MILSTHHLVLDAESLAPLCIPNLFKPYSGDFMTFLKRNLREYHGKRS